MDKAIFFRVLNRINLFFFSNMLVLILLYIIGNQKNFMDSTQLFLLNSIIIFSIFLILVSFITLIAAVIYYIMNKQKIYLYHIPHLIIFFILSIIVLFFSRVMTFVSDGI